MAGTVVFRITQQKNEKMLHDFAALGLEGVLTDIQRNETNRIGILAKQATQSAVPIEHGQLRRSIVLRPEGAKEIVEIQNTLRSPARKNQITNARLADVLFEEDHWAYGTPFTRRKDSETDGPFQAQVEGDPTKGWVDKAKQSLDAELKK